MIKLSRKMEYALVALKHMLNKRPGERSTAKEVSDTYNTPFDVTARVMQILAQSSLLKSEQGSQGGYSIIKDLSKVTVNDLIEIIEGPTQIVKCLQDEAPCEVKTKCNIVSPVQQLNQRLIQFYSSVNLKDLLISTKSAEKIKDQNNLVIEGGVNV